MITQSQLVLLLALLVINGLCNNSKAQQQTLFSQYQFVGLDVSPAIAGRSDNLTVNSANQIQHIGFEENATANMLTAHVPIVHKSVGVGLVIKNDRYGREQINECKGIASYRIKAMNGSLSFGLALSGLNQNFNASSATAKDLDDELYQTETTKTNFNVSSGLYFKHRKYEIAVSGNNLLQERFQTSSSTSDDNVLYQRIAYNIMGGFKQPIVSALIWKPTLFCHLNSKETYYVDISNQFEIDKKVWVGLSFDTAQKLGVSTGCNIDKLINSEHGIVVGYSYGYGFSEYFSASKGIHEIAFQFQLQSRPSSTGILDAGKAVSPLTF